MTDEFGIASSFGLKAFAGTVDDVDVYVRDVTDHEISRARFIHADLFSGKPFLCAVTADMDHGICAETAFFFRFLKPQVKGGILVRRRDRHIVVEFFEIFIPAAGGFRHHDDVAVEDDRENEITGTVACHGHEIAFSRFAPFRSDVVDDLLFAVRHVTDPGFVCRDREKNDGSVLKTFIDEFFKFARRPAADVSAAGHDQVFNLFFVVRRDGIAVIAQCFEDIFERSEEIQVTGADVLFSRRVVEIDESDLFFAVGRRSELCIIHGLTEKTVDAVFDRIRDRIFGRHLDLNADREERALCFGLVDLVIER